MQNRCVSTLIMYSLCSVENFSGGQKIQHAYALVHCQNTFHHCKDRVAICSYWSLSQVSSSDTFLVWCCQITPRCSFSKCSVCLCMLMLCLFSLATEIDIFFLNYINLPSISSPKQDFNKICCFVTKCLTWHLFLQRKLFWHGNVWEMFPRNSPADSTVCL